MNRKDRRREKAIASRTKTSTIAMNSDPTTAADTATTSTSEQETASASKSLFHYTNAAGLIGIIESQTLFATHANFLNDSTECRILTDILKPRMVKETEQLIGKLISAGLLKPEVLNEQQISSLQTDAMISAILRATENISPIYICSFCLHEKTDLAYENGLLSQWRGYANGGFAIEFDEHGIDKMALVENQSFRYQGILTNVVHYHDHEKHADLDRFNGLAAATNRLLFENGGKRRDDIFGKQNINNYVRPLLNTLPFLKDPGFSEEQEYRIAALCNRPGVFERADNRRERRVEFRVSATGSVIPYIRMFEGLGAQLPIKGILIGPHRNQDNQDAALKLLLDQKNIKVDVRRSKLTFRET